ncbi:MAG: DEAD/DEAH box helicase [Pirellulales bacterium]|nr:DEAD/DEAH box helicase [Pirellulales bacterium]
MERTAGDVRPRRAVRADSRSDCRGPAGDAMNRSAGENSLPTCTGTLRVPIVGSWFASPPPKVMRIVPAAERRPQVLKSLVVGRGSLVEVGPQPMAVAVPRFRVSVRSFRFTEASLPDGGIELPTPSPSLVNNRLRPTTHDPRPTKTSVTRIKSPGDVIKLEDRLDYLLQPPLESILAEGALGFPARPFAYQFEGMAFLYPRHAAILADEMGLGKTMQAITALRLLVHRGEVRCALLICPKSLVSNWEREFRHWAPELPVTVIEGDQARRAWQWRLPDVPLRIANYEILVRDREIFQSLEAPPCFDLVLLDESQRIKNRHGATSQAVRSLARRRSWALTGTPVENSTEDLVGIFEFLAPGFLSPDLKPRKLGRMVGDYVLRRTKDQVLGDLPPLLVQDETLDLTPPQRASYRLAEDEGVVHLSELGSAVSIQHVFELVIRLKQICNFDPATGESAKFERLEADLEEIAASGRKAIVFSQWVATLKRLAERLRRFGPLEYHGQIPPPQRDAVVRRFREDDSRHVILMSYGAGGVGLNLQFAHYVFLFDRWWNPAVEDQAINRAHRIGVSGPVHVTRFLTLDTIEERIDHILQEKRDLFNTIFSGTTAPKKLGLTQDDLFRLFQLPRPADKAA